VPSALAIVQDSEALHVRSATILEWGDDEVSVETLTLDGRDVVSEVDRGRRVRNARFSAARDTLTITTRIAYVSGGRPVEARSTDTWTLRRHGQQLVILQTTESSSGPVASTLVYDKQ
jgi:hypothetical protein